LFSLQVRVRFSLESGSNQSEVLEDFPLSQYLPLRTGGFFSNVAVPSIDVRLGEGHARPCFLVLAGIKGNPTVRPSRLRILYLGQQRDPFSYNLLI